ncbi:WW domain-containing-binding 4 [Hyphodiscus hymeniophilus]|uniref:WW domain-containing-binding 4 n=1 Tax=Hyphodiscus hymeniophilus TaxID=353542 RepID=A0A9P6VK37_9HELO|nr:WW domain-containing-binding 4 [Hyphodiscus hymeniophilus]
MSEYWKSTPKYWCKHCKTFVRDTKLEKANHDATPKHQGNLKRFLRDLHRGHEKDEKDKERAKAEVARLNGMTAGGGSGAVASSSISGFGRGPTPSLPKPQATPAQRKQQLAQLAEMGVAIPDEFRPDMAMAGEWEVTSERIVEEHGKRKPDAMALGVRKRVPDEAEAEEIESKKRKWGSTYRSHPAEEDDGELDSLLNNVTRKGKVSSVETEIKGEVKEEACEVVKTEPGDKNEAPADLLPNGERTIKREPSEGETAMPQQI